MLQTDVKGWLRRAFGTPLLDDAVKNFGAASDDLLACLEKLGGVTDDAELAEARTETTDRERKSRKGHGQPGNGVNGIAEHHAETETAE